MIEKMGTVLLAEIVEGVGNATHDRGDRFARRSGANGEDWDVFDAVKAGILDAPLVELEKFAAQSFLGAEMASDTIANAAT